jgi:ketosteroid isomerase-like protein
MIDDRVKSADLCREYFRRVDTGSASLLDLFADDVKIYFPKYGIGTGKAALLEILTQLGNLFESVQHDEESYRYIASGDFVVVEGTTKGVLKSGERWAAGSTPAGRFCNVFEFKSGLIARLHVYLDPDYAGTATDTFLWGREGRLW